MRAILKLLLASSLLHLPVSARVAQTARAAAEGRWQVEVAHARCRLTRSVTNGPFAISVETVPGADDYSLALAGPNLGDFNTSGLVPAALGFDGDAPPITGMAQGRRIGGALGTVVRFRGLSPQILDRLSAAGSIALSRGTTEIGRYDIGDASKAVAALRRCNAEQLIEWGADPAQFDPGGSTPIALTSRDNWLSNADLMRINFADVALNASLRVGVGIDGTIISCTAINTGGSANVAAVACKALSGKILFAPAYGPDGKKVAGAATFQIEMVRRPNR